jgi:SMI1-KNR4 cell-wall
MDEPKHIIGPNGPQWPDLSQLRTKITEWETASGYRFPEDYRTFMLRYDGGRPYPNTFKVAVPPNLWDMAEDLTYVDPLYSWDFSRALQDKTTYYEGTPNGFWFIGCDPGGLELLLSLRAKDYGRVYSWRGTYNAWGTAGNDDTTVYLQAGSFERFLFTLFDTPDKQGYNYWQTPHQIMLARDITLT